MSDQLLVGTRKGLFRVARGAARAAWEITSADFLATPVPIVLPDARTSAIYAALDHEHFGVKLHRSDDSGETWREIDVPVYPPKPDGLDDRDPVTGEPVEWSLRKIWALEADTGASNGDARLWCGTMPGGLFLSESRGESWSLVRSLWDHPKRHEWMGGGFDYPGIHSICVNPANDDHVAVGVSVGGVWETVDGGTTWQCRAQGMWADYVPAERAYDPYVQDPHRVVQCAADPKWLWATHHNGSYVSSDGARSWRELSMRPSSFGFAVAVHPHEPRTAWFVPAVSDDHRIPARGQVVVTRTRDGGATFEVLREGLPQRHAYDIVYRHALDVDDSGGVLAFGSTTGSLWVSEDQGDSWSAISHHLPPVYCVRFVH